MKDNQGITKVSTVIVLALSIILAIGLASAASSFFFNQDGTILVSAYVDNVIFENNDWIEWGDLTGGVAETVEFSVYNAGNVALNISLIITDLPSDWTETWLKNGTAVMPKSWLNDTLTLTPHNALADYYSWNTTLLAQ